MKTISKINLLLSAFLLSSCGLSGDLLKNNVEVLEPDNIEYKENNVANLRSPDFRSEGADDEEEEESFVVDKVILHYYNEDGNCNKAGTAGRAFYVWVPGIDGQEYSDESNNTPSSRVEYSSDGTLMTITIDMINDDMFKLFYGCASVMYIIKYKMESKANLNWGGQSEDVELKFSTFNPVNKVVEVWSTPAAGGGIAQFDSEEKTKVEGVKLAYFDSWKNIHCSLTANATKVNWDLYAFDETYYKVKAKNRAAIKKNYKVKSGTATSDFDIAFTYNAHINAVYCIESSDVNGTPGLTKIIYASFEKLYGTARFEKYYNYKGNDLGATYTPEATTFKVWSPVAANVSVLLYNSDTSAAYDGSDKYKGWHMNYQPGGIWTLTIEGDLANSDYKYYNYQVDTWSTSGVCMDPYAKACGACGVRGMILDLDSTNPQDWNQLNSNLSTLTTPQDLTIYEVHVQDFTGDESWVSNNNNKRGTFNAFVEKGTTISDGTHTVSTGFDHLVDLGVRAVQLVPVFDSDNDEVKNTKYNWGYNPLNYNCVEGAYSSNPHDGAVRIREYKNMISELAKEDIRTIMDVVYNHVSSPSASCFNKLMPRYYFRYDENGELYDGSGCHNEFKSEATMARKFIVDSVCFWAEEYNIKGFRFDLMALIDVETMRAVKKALYQIDPSIYLYGEGWTSGGFHGGWDAENNLQSQGCFAVPGGQGYQVYTDLYNKTPEECYLGAFDGSGRDALKGENNFGDKMYGFINKGKEDLNAGYKDAIQRIIYGQRGDNNGGNPKQTIAYASCHDNWTLRDQLYYTLGDTNSKAGNIYDVIHGSLAAQTVIFASNSAAFMLGGEELLRSKEIIVGENGVTQEEFDKIPLSSYENLYGHYVSHNSYNSPICVNSFKWGNKLSLTVDGITVDMYEENLANKYKELIALHKEMPKLDLDGINNLYNNKITSKGNAIDNFSWNGLYWDNEDKVNCSVIGVQFDEWFIFVCARTPGYLRDSTIPSWTNKFSTGTISYNNDTNCLDLGDMNYKVGLCATVYKR